MTKKKSTKKNIKKKTGIVAKVVSITDGDTFKINKKVKGSRNIRLAGTDAPERGQRGSVQAKKNLAKKVLDKKVKIKPKGKSYQYLIPNMKQTLKNAPVY